MGAANIIALILQGTNVVTTLAPITLATALKLQAIFRLHGGDDEEDFKLEIRAFQDGAILAANETIALIDAWKAEHGYPQ